MKTVQDDEASWSDALSSTALFLALSQHAPGVSDMMHRVVADATASPMLEKLPTARNIFLTLFTTQEIVAYPLTEEHQRAVEAHPASHTAGPEIHARWKNTLRRVIQHNIRVVSGYYRQLSMAPLGQFIRVICGREAEKHVSDMVSDNGMYAKIDRPQGA